MFRKSMTPANNNKIMVALKDLTNRIEIGQKHIRSDDRQSNIKVTKWLIREEFTAADVAALSHGPGMVFDFENSIRRSRTETARHEFKQGLLRLDDKRQQDPGMVRTILETICGISNAGPDVDGFLYVGIADKSADAKRVETLDGVTPITFDHVQIVGVGREAIKIGITVDKYLGIIANGITAADLSDPLKTNVLTSLDVITYRGLEVDRIRVPRQSQPSFLDQECYLRVGSSTIKATGPQIAAVSKLFSLKAAT
jgi:predicted HTH transcriptional regulator